MRNMKDTKGMKDITQLIKTTMDFDTHYACLKQSIKEIHDARRDDNMEEFQNKLEELILYIRRLNTLGYDNTYCIRDYPKLNIIDIIPFMNKLLDRAMTNFTKVEEYTTMYTQLKLCCICAAESMNVKIYI